MNKETTIIEFLKNIESIQNNVTDFKKIISNEMFYGFDIKRISTSVKLYKPEKQTGKNKKDPDWYYEIFLGRYSTKTYGEHIKKKFDLSIEIKNNPNDYYKFHWLGSIRLDENLCYIENTVVLNEYVKNIIMETKSYSESDFKSDLNAYIINLFREKILIQNIIPAISNKLILECLKLGIKFEMLKDEFVIHFTNELEDSIKDLQNFYLKDINKLLIGKFIRGSKKILDLKTENINLFLNTEQAKFSNINDSNVSKVLNLNNYSSCSWPLQFNLNLMQQFAVNSYKDAQNIFSVNGPPGTGKTTLLKEVIADVIYEKAQKMYELHRSEILFRNDNGKDKVNEKMLDFAIVVASNNNSAIENITKEVLSIDSFSKDFQDIDYFKEFLKVENSVGIISQPLGKSANIKKSLEIISRDNFLNVSIGQFSSEKIQLQIVENTKLINAEKEKLQRKINTYKSMENELENLENNILVLNSEYKDIQENIDKYQEDLNSYIVVKNELNLKILSASELLELYKQESLFQRIKIYIGLHEKYRQEYSIFIGYKNELISLENSFYIFKNIYDTEQVRLLEKEKILNEYLLLLKNLKKKLKVDLNDICLNNDNLKIRFKAYLKNSCETSVNVQEFNPIMLLNPDIEKLRKENFRLSINLMREIIVENKDTIIKILNTSKMGKRIIDLLLLIIPVTSTTLAAVGKMFEQYDYSKIGNVLIDEAGQATIASGLGLIARSKKVMVLGDPFQITPVQSTDEELFSEIRNKISTDESYGEITQKDIKYLDSIQTFADRINPVGIYMNNIWIGSPLYIHRRCINPMFDISNKLAYDNKMILCKDNIGKTSLSRFIHVESDSKTGSSHYVENQIVAILELLESDFQNDVDVYVITPFTLVKYGVIKYLKENKKDLHKFLKNRIGTIHAFQGKEASKVYFLAGVSKGHEHSADWVNSVPNILNVSVTRAKKDFIFVGDRKIWNMFSFSKTVIEHLEINSAKINSK